MDPPLVITIRLPKRKKKGGVHPGWHKWTALDRMTLQKAVQNHGKKWTRIKRDHFPNLTVSSIRSEHERMLQGEKERAEYKQLEMHGLAGRKKNVCHICGLIKHGHICLVDRNAASSSSPPGPSLSSPPPQALQGFAPDDVQAVMTMASMVLCN